MADKLLTKNFGGRGVMLLLWVHFKFFLHG